MKASMKFREEQKPLFRAKVPLNILGFPFQSGVVAGESKELSLNLSTFFESGPSVKVAYRPNDSINPFSLVFKTGIGHLGSPISSSLNMSAEFNLIGGAQNPTNLNFRWGFRLPATEETAMVLMKKNNKSTAGISFQTLPVLIINKIGIEHVARDHCRTSSKAGPGSSDVADAFLGVKKQLEMIQAENGMLRKAMDNLKAEFSAVKSGNNAVRFNGGDKGHFGRKAMDDDLVNDELKNGSKGISDI
ncbi:hypothetical protein Ccrd_018184 [Cynara cardunculus var. scolymus]|uniref:Uncharacterized protein n=1 Tax=Cynara cardunculus var. scolymus TaxID=59895 RepID=A0A103Y6P4_CYNCS|nr:hypothetical protein Ccrd_018184 [Cynara cardunculus var. scolymus]